MTKKQKIKFIALLTTTASLAVGSYFFKKKVEKMKEDGSFNTMVFKTRLNQYLKAAKKDELTLFKEFFKNRTDMELTEDEEKVMIDIINGVNKV